MVIFRLGNGGPAYNVVERQHELPFEHGELPSQKTGKRAMMVSDFLYGPSGAVRASSSSIFVMGSFLTELVRGRRLARAVTRAQAISSCCTLD